MSLFKAALGLGTTFIGSSWLWPTVAIGVALLAAHDGVQTYRLGQSQAREVKTQAGWDSDKAQAERRDAEREKKERIKEQGLQADKERIVDEARKREESLRADLAISDAARGSLRARLDAYVAAARKASQNPQVVAGSPSTDDPIGVLADVLGRCDARAELLAKFADRTHSAGIACQQQYDSVEGAQE